MKFWPAIVFALVLPGQTKSADDLLQQGLALARSEQFEEAAAVFIEGRQAYPRDPRFALELAGVSYRRNESAKAKSLLHAALSLNPADRYGNEFLGSLYLLDGNLEGALKFWNRIGRAVIGNVSLLPAPPLDPVLSSRLSDVSGGQLFTLRRYDRTLANLEALNIFSEYRLELMPRLDERYDLAIHTVPRSSAGARWWWRLLPYLRGLPYQQVNADFYNLAEKAINVTSLSRWDSVKRRAAIQLSGPSGLSRYRISIDVRDERWDLRRTYNRQIAAVGDVVLQRAEAGAEATFHIGETLQWTPGLWMSGRRFRNVESTDLFRNGWLAEIRNRLDVRLFRWPDRRIRIDGWALLRTGQFIANGSSRFISPQAGARMRWFPQARGEKYELNTTVRAGGAFGAVPLDEMFILGMERDNDLWLRGHIGTRDGRKGNAPMGSRFALVNTDLMRELLRIPFLRVQAGPFFDFGQTASSGGTPGSQGPLCDTGIQVTLFTAGRVRISAVYGRDLRGGRPAVYTAVSR